MSTTRGHTVRGARPSIDIVMPTFDGGTYLREQVESIRRQTFQEWRLLFRDDGSSDETTTILASYVDEDPSRFVVVDGTDGRLGPMRSVDVLLHASTAEYVALADQDDVWMPDKLELVMADMARIEARTGGSQPVLVHSDLEVVDSRMNVVAPSMARYMRLDARRRTHVRQFLVQNTVTGCTVLVNRPLLSLALPIPSGAVMHDWWLALVASACGSVGFVDRSTVRYRQHGSNAVGAKRAGFGRVGESRRARDRFEASFRQAELLLERIDARGASCSRSVEAYAHLAELGWLARRRTIVSHRFFMSDPLRNLAMMSLP